MCSSNKKKKKEPPKTTNNTTEDSSTENSNWWQPPTIQSRDLSGNYTLNQKSLSSPLITSKGTSSLKIPNNTGKSSIGSGASSTRADERFKRNPWTNPSRAINDFLGGILTIGRRR